MGNHIVSALRDGVKRLAHVSGGLPAYHRLRNDCWLTVLCFHRVLPPSDARARYADPDWTISVDLFADSVDFAKRHFNVVSLEAVLEARRHGASLPPRPILLTFDDGWSDNEEYALPVLEAAKVPAVVFVTTDAIDRRTPMWFERIRMAHLDGRVDDQLWSSLWSATGHAVPAERSEREIVELLRLLSTLTAPRRDELLARFESQLDDARHHMVTLEQIKRLEAGGVAIGAHGKSHQPLSHCEDLEDELREPRRRLEAILGHPVTTLALPHSRFTPDVIHRAERAGYELVFTGERQLAPVRVIPFTVGRVAITPDGLTDARGRLRPDAMGLHLFRRPHLSVDEPIVSRA